MTEGQSIPAIQLSEDQICAIVRDEIRKAIAEKLGEITKALLGSLAKTASTRWPPRRRRSRRPPRLPETTST